jgi:hypothetical protein
MKQRLEAEGHRVIQKGQRYLVEGFARHMARLG